MQTHKKLKARILSLALSAAMVTTMMPINAFAAEGGTAPGTSSVGNIQSFDKLEDRFTQSIGENAPTHVYGLTVALDTPAEDLNLPDELTAMVARTTTVSAPAEDDPVVDSGKPSTPAEDETIPDEDEVATDDTAADDTVSGNQPASPSDAKEEVKEEIEDEDVPLAPEPEQDEETVVTTVEQETISVTWKSDKEYKSDENDKFIYTAVLPEGYVLADGVKLPQIYVYVGKQARAGVISQRTKVLDFTKSSIEKQADSSSWGDPTSVDIDALAEEGWKWEKDSKTLTLNNLNLAVAGSPLTLPGNSTITLAGDATIENTATTTPLTYAVCVLTAGNLNINGDGTFLIKGLKSGSYGGIANEFGSINISGNNCKIDIELKNTSGIIGGSSSAASGSVTIDGAQINISSSSGTAIYGYSSLSIKDSKIKFIGSGAGLRSVKQGINITNSEITLDCSGIGEPIYAQGANLTISDSTVIAKGGTTALYVPKGNVNIIDSKVTGTSTKTQGHGIWGTSISFSGGKTQVTVSSVNLGALSAKPTLENGIKPYDLNDSPLSEDAAWSKVNEIVIYSAGAQAPNITNDLSTSEISYIYNQSSPVTALSILATASGTLTYQWYSNTANDAINGTEISGATGATYTPPITEIGTKYYYCILTNTDNSMVGVKTATQSSQIAKITVNKATATSAMTTVATSVSKDGKMGAAVTLPAKPTGASYGTPTASGTIAITNMSMSGDTLTYTAPASTAGQTGTITIPVTGATNYNDYSITVTITSVAKTPVTVTGLTSATGLTYSGSAQNGYTGTISVEGNSVPVSELVYTYTSTDSGTYNSSTAPTNAGAYKLTIKIADSNASYTGAHADITFTIGKKAATVTADNKSIVIGAAKPTYTATTDGLVTGQSISGVTFTDTATDTNTKGTFDINPSGGTITGGNDNYSITYTKGTLTITVATQVIDTAIANANAAKNGIAINEGTPSSVANGTKYVTAAEMKALTDAIAAAEAAKSTAGTAAEAQAAATALDNAVAVFKAAIKTGTYTSSSGGGGGGSSSGGGSTPITKPTEPVTGNSNTNATVDNKGNATVNVTDKNIADAVQAAKDAANKKGVNAGEVTAVINVTSPVNSNPNTVTVNLPKTVQDQIISNKIGNVAIVIDKPDISIGMTLATITEMNKQAKADIQLSATRTDATKLSTEAKNAIGNRPAFDLKATYNSGAKSITNFGTGTVSVAIPYTLQKGEVAGGLYAVYVDGNGKVTHLTNSSYDAENKVLRFSTNHFSVYGIGYKAPVGLTDIANHWAKTDIEFVVGRGLMTGTSNTTFSPDGSMTRAMFVTALGRLAGVDTNSYKTSKFTDVKADAYYAPYVNWAASKGITNGTTVTTFSPDNTVTRQEMAVFMSNYAKAMGYTVPETRAAVSFADNGSIGSWAATAVKQMQMAGVLNGKNGNKFDPTGTATRAEVAAVLHRYVELVIDRTTTEGWTTNDSGSGMYYQNGKALTGSRVLSGTTYVFNNYGETTRKTNTAGATTTALATDGKKYITHKIVKGDTLWNLAQKHGTTVNAIMALNSIVDRNRVPIGTEIKIPQK